MASGAGATFQDKAFNKVAVCSAVFAGFAYVGYSYARSAFCRKLYKHPEDEQDETSQISQVVLRRMSDATQTDSMFGYFENNGSRRLFVRPKSVQDRLRELNVRARQFTDAFIAIKTGNNYCGNIISRNNAVHGFKSIQCSPRSSPRVLSPVDAHHLFFSRSTDNLHQLPHSFSPSRPKWIRRSLKKKSPKETQESEDDLKQRLREEALTLLNNMPKELLDRLHDLGQQPSVLTPFEAKCLVAILYSEDKRVVEKALVTIANCAAFSVNLDFLREVGCIHQLCTLLQDPTLCLPSIQTLGNVILSEENIKQAKNCLPLLMEYIQSGNQDEAKTLASLVVLTNLATTSEWHEDFCPVLSRLYQLVDCSNSHIQLQSLRLLVNLSCNKSMVPALIAAEGPKKLGYLLTMDTTDPLLLRTVTLLATLAASVKYDQNESSNECGDNTHKENLIEKYGHLFGVGVRERLLSQAHHIMNRHPDREINRQATRLYEALRD